VISSRWIRVQITGGACKACVKMQNCCSRFLCNDCCNGDKHTVEQLACGHLVVCNVKDGEICKHCQEIKNQQQEEAAWRDDIVAIQQFLPSVTSKRAKMKLQGIVAEQLERSDTVPQQDSTPSPPRSKRSDDPSSTKKRRKTSN